MPAPINNLEFLDFIRRSGVVDDAKLKSATQTIQSSTNPPQVPKALADAFIEHGILTNFQAEQLLLGKWKRFHIGKYKVLERIGVGGMGQVFLCEHKIMRRRVAVKVLPTSKADDPAALERFYREARAVAAVDHPNIVRAYDIDQDDNIHFLVMEFVDGANLQEIGMKRIQRTGRPVDVLEACHYIYGSAVGLQHAHEMGLVHRDIKPGNILVDRSGMVKLLDMGLARFFYDDNDHLTKKYDENILGTADYLAPEQAIDSHSVDIRADIYSLGATFYFLLVGKPPVPEGSVAQKLLWHQQKTAKPVSEIRQDVPKEIEAIIVKMMEKDPANRYQTPAEVMTALSPFVQIPIAPPPEEELPRMSLAAGGSSTSPGMARTGVGSSSGSMVSVGVSPASGWGGGVYPTVAGVTTATAPSALQGLDTAEAVWGNLNGETLVTKAEPKASAAITLKPARETTTKPKNKLLLYVGGGVALVLALAVGGYFALVKGKTNTTTPTNAVASTGRIYVTKGDTSPDSSRTHNTLAAALAAAKPKDVIVLLDEKWDEGPIKLETRGKTSLKDVTIESATPGRPAVWTVSAPKVTPSSEQAVLELVNVSGMTIRNITINANNTMPVGLAIVGSCTGLQCENITVLNAKRIGVKVGNAAGDPGLPIKLTNVRVVSAPGVEAGLAFSASTSLSNKLIQVHQCRFEGPAKSAVVINGPMVEVELKENRIYQAELGVSFTGGLYASSSLQLAFIQNTFFDVKSAIRVDGEMPNGIKPELLWKQNYFGKSGELITFMNSRGQNLPGLKLIDNVRDGKTREGKISFQTLEIKDVELTNTDASSSQFLKYPRDSKLNQVGPNKVPVGVPPD